MAGTEGPLAGVTVVDLTRILAGPWCTLRLACVPTPPHSVLRQCLRASGRRDLGATVIKVEPETGSGERYGLHSGICYHSGKQSIALDWMNDDDDRATFESLLGTADVLVENCVNHPP